MPGQPDEEVLPSARVLGGWEALVEWNDDPLPPDLAAAFAGATVPATA